LDGLEGPVAQLAAGLRELREKAGKPGYRQMAARVNYSVATLSAAASGRRLPTQEVTLAYVAACGGDVQEWERRWREAERLSVASAEEPAAVNGHASSPYPGLATFQPQDAEVFFGRGVLVDELVRRLGQRRFLAVFGPSGAGKSSVVRAGLVPAVGGPAVVLTPGVHPMAELAVHLARHAGVPAGGVLDELRADPARAQLMVRQGLPDVPEDVDLLVVVDQFEEVFASCADPAERNDFVAALLSMCREPDGRARVVLAVRADHYTRFTEHPELLAELADAQVLIGGMSPAELREAVTKPAERCRARVEGALVATIVAQVSDSPGALPLAAHALREAWHRRQGAMVTLAGYQDAGGVAGAVARTAEQAYERLSEQEQDVARRVLLRMVDVGPDGLITRRRLSRTELDTVERAPAVLEAFAAARLVSTDRDTVEIAHEALIRAWPRLSGWVEESRAGLRLHRQLTEAAAAWEALGRDQGALYRGLRLSSTVEAADAKVIDLTGTEREFLRASRQNQQARARRARRVNAVLAGLLAVVLVVASVAVWQWRTAVTAQQIALARQLAAVSRQVATQAQTLVDSRPDTAMLLGVQAYRTAPTVEARSALIGMSTHGAYQAEFTAHSGPVSDLAFTADGRTLVTASKDHSIAVWDTHDHHRIASLTGHDTWLRAVAITADGATMASGGDDQDIVLWDLASDVRIATLVGHTGAVKDVAFSPDGRLLASGGADDTVILWDLAQRTAIARLTGHGGTVNSVAFSPNGRLLAAAGTGHTIVLWDVATHTRVRTLVGHTDVVNQVAFDPRGRYLASAGDTTVRLWNVVDGSPRKVLTGHTDGVKTLAFSPDGATLASAGYDTTVLLWDVGSGMQRARLAGHTTSVYALAFGTDSTLASAGERGSVILWNTDRASLVETAGDGVKDLAFSQDGRSLVEAANNLATVWDTRKRRRLHVFTSTSTVNAVALSPDGLLLATANEDSTVTLWDLKSGTQVTRLTGHHAAVLDVAFSPDGRTLVTGSVDKTAIVWDLATRIRRTTLTGHTAPINGVAFSPDGRTLASASHDFTAMLWNTADWSPRTRLAGHKGWVRAVTFSPDGRTAATASNDSTIRLWDTATGTLRATLTGHSDAEFNGVTFSPDGTTLAFTSGEHTISLWKINVQMNWARLTGHTTTVRAEAFSPDGHTLATADGAGAILFWDTDAERTAQRICDTFGRDLTDDEWNQFVPDLPHHNKC
jgi:WD40 repeat protein